MVPNIYKTIFFIYLSIYIILLDYVENHKTENPSEKILENNRESIQFNSIQLTLGDDKKKIKNKKNAKGKRVEPLNKNQHHRSCPTQNLEWRNSLGVL